MHYVIDNVFSIIHLCHGKRFTLFEIICYSFQCWSHFIKYVQQVLNLVYGPIDQLAISVSANYFDDFLLSRYIFPSTGRSIRKLNIRIKAANLEIKKNIFFFFGEKGVKRPRNKANQMILVMFYYVNCGVRKFLLC